jgi:hypothetical protein
VVSRLQPVQYQAGFATSSIATHAWRLGQGDRSGSRDLGHAKLPSKSGRILQPCPAPGMLRPNNSSKPMPLRGTA